MTISTNMVTQYQRQDVSREATPETLEQNAGRIIAAVEGCLYELSSLVEPKPPLPVPDPVPGLQARLEILEKMTAQLHMQLSDLRLKIGIL